MLRLFLVIVLFSTIALAEARDPGMRTGKVGVGKALGGLNLREQINFSASKTAFSSTRNVRDGMGPAFNGDSCVICHSHPATGGSSPVVNPQINLATRARAKNFIPSFLSTNGPVREVRFKYQLRADGTLSDVRDGGVHAVFSIAGRSDAGNCDLTQPDFERHLALNNLSFRIPTPTFGMGLIEAIRDTTILASFNATATQRAALGIGGHPNRSHSDGTISRFGWKAQHKSAEMFAAEAYNVEMGITNDQFPQERTTKANCMLNATPEDHTQLSAILSIRSLSAVTKFAIFMRTTAPPTSATPNASTTRGYDQFKTIGCAACHTPSMPIVGASSPEVRRFSEALLFSDLLVHKMGPGLADDIIQGDAGPDEFRTSPLWGLGQRVFFLHDGRTSDLAEAIEAHASPADAHFEASEANAVVQRYRGLPESSKQDLLNFLRAL